MMTLMRSSDSVVCRISRPEADFLTALVLHRVKRYVATGPARSRHPFSQRQIISRRRTAPQKASQYLSAPPPYLQPHHPVFKLRRPRQ